MDKTPNPQGKGLVPVLETLAASRAAIAVPPKRIDQISSELFTSLFVLESDFKFRPVVGRSYWLYRKGERFWLSMLAPHEWSAAAFGQVIGECTLQDDITWTLTLDEAAAQDTALLHMIEAKKLAFEKRLEEAETVDEALPVFDESLPFFQRVCASALAASLRVSMQKSGIEGLSYDEARGLLAAPEAAADRDD